MNILIREEVTLHVFPQPRVPQLACEITFGDLHGNALKLLYFLLREGICSVTEEDYQRICTLYYIDALDFTEENKKEFDRIIERIVVQKRHVLLRLLGDDVCDRGQNDYFTLKILEKLVAESVPIEILASNHALAFIEADEIGPYFTTTHFGGDKYSRSMDNLQLWIDWELVDFDEIKKSITQYYKPLLKALAYTVNSDNEITIFTHAPIDIETIMALATQLSLNTADDNTPLALARTIDAINACYESYVRTKTVHQLYKMHGNATPFLKVVWNRNYQILNRAPFYKGYRVNFVHGHDSNGPSQANVKGMNNTLGCVYISEGRYEVLVNEAIPPLQHKKDKNLAMASALLEAMNLNGEREEEYRLLKTLATEPLITLQGLFKETWNVEHTIETLQALQFLAAKQLTEIDKAKLYYFSNHILSSNQQILNDLMPFFTQLQQGALSEAYQEELSTVLSFIIERLQRLEARIEESFLFLPNPSVSMATDRSDLDSSKRTRKIKFWNPVSNEEGTNSQAQSGFNANLGV